MGDMREGTFWGWFSSLPPSLALQQAPVPQVERLRGGRVHRKGHMGAGLRALRGRG